MIFHFFLLCGLWLGARRADDKLSAECLAEWRLLSVLRENLRDRLKSQIIKTTLEVGTMYS